jgi:hypothetical protein
VREKWSSKQVKDGVEYDPTTKKQPITHTKAPPNRKEGTRRDSRSSARGPAARSKRSPKRGTSSTTSFAAGIVVPVFIQIPRDVNGASFFGGEVSLAVNFTITGGFIVLIVRGAGVNAVPASS